MKDIEELKKILQEHKYELENEYGVTEIGVFGSYSKKQETIKMFLQFLI